MDGVIVNHSSSHFPPYYGQSDELKENTEILRRLYQTGKFQIIITTSRSSKYRDITEKQLKKFNVGYDILLMDMFHSKRIIINDYSNANPFKSCDAINLKRNARHPRQIGSDRIYIKFLFGYFYPCHYINERSQGIDFQFQLLFFGANIFARSPLESSYGKIPC